MTITMDFLLEVDAKARFAAAHAVGKFLEEFVPTTEEERRRGEPMYPCGFSYVYIPVDGRSKTARVFKSAGFKRSDYEKAFVVNCPTGYMGQNMDVKEAGTIAYARVLTEHGIKCYVKTRMD